MMWPSRTFAQALLALICALSAAAETPGPPRVEIRNPDGTLYGTLRLNERGDALLLSWQGQEHPAGECVDEMRDEAKGGGLSAVVYERNCGATVDFATLVALRAASRTEIVAVFLGRPHVALKWSAGKLEVTHSPLPTDEVFKRLETTSDGLKITYVVVGAMVAPSSYVDHGSYSFGATGRAAGMPVELLFRLAGWSQEASGLHRPEWGTWLGDPPYGDDPRGRTMVRDGIQYYECKHRGEKECAQSDGSKPQPPAKP